MCVDVGGVVFALISHKRKTVVCILNTPIPSSIFPLACCLPCSWCTHYCWKWCSNTRERRVCADRKKGQKNREGEMVLKKKKHLVGICFPWPLPLALFPLLYSYKYEILQSVFYARSDCIWMLWSWRRWVCGKNIVCVYVCGESAEAGELFLQHGSRWNADLQTSPGSPGFLEAWL